MEPAQIADVEVKGRAVRAALAPLLTVKTSEQLFSAAKQVGELMEHPGWAFLEELLEGRKAFILAQLVHGATPEKHEFAALLSMCSGIDQVLYAGQVVKTLAAEKERELEQQAAQAGEEQG